MGRYEVLVQSNINLILIGAKCLNATAKKQSSNAVRRICGRIRGSAIHAPKPEHGYYKHFGYIPDEPYFHNSAVAWNTPDMRLSLRTKQQLLEYVKEGNVETLMTRSGKPVVYLSIFKSSEDYKTENGMMNVSAKGKAYYMVRHKKLSCSPMGEKTPKREDWRISNPFFSTQNTYMLPIDELETLLTDDEPTDEERIAIGKRDEAVQALNEEELDRLLASANEALLREHYEYDNGEPIIDTFISEKGETFYQPRKKDSTWLSCVLVLPFKIEGTTLIVPAAEEMVSQNIHTGKVLKDGYR